MEKTVPIDRPGHKATERISNWIDYTIMNPTKKEDEWPLSLNDCENK